jgi:hypothetical protein
MKKGIKSDIDAAWIEYRENSRDTIGDTLVSAFLGKLTSNIVRGQKRNQTATNRDNLIAAYRKVEATIDDLLLQINNAKGQLQSFINEENKKQRSTQQHSEKVHKRVQYRKYIKSQEWRTKAEEAKVSAGNRCQVCNRSRAEVQLDAHHRTYERLGNELPEDITVLCRECHQLYEDAKKVVPKPKIPEKGLCIRCQQTIKLNPQAPYCRSCFRVWKRFENPTYQEKYCHICGKEDETTMLKPVCYDCYKEYQDDLQFSAS